MGFDYLENKTHGATRQADRFSRMANAVIRWKRAGKQRHPMRTLLIRIGVVLIAVGSIYLVGGLTGLLPLETENLAWNNIRIVSGTAILGCLLAAVGYGNE